MDLDTSEDQNIIRITQGLPLLKPNSGGAFYRTVGDFVDFLSKFFSNGKKIFPLTIEICTLGNVNFWQAIRASFLMVAENRIRHHGSWFQKNELKIQNMFFRYFYSDSELWRTTILNESFETINNLI